MPPASPFVVPFKKPRLIGRDGLLRELHESMQRAESGGIPAICGQPGVGKTQFAALYIHTYRAAFPSGVFWLDLTQAHAGAVLRQVGGSFARALGLTSGIADPTERDRDLSEQWLGQVRNDPGVLIVADSLDDPLLLHGLPGLPHSDLTSLDCKILVTTRIRGLPGCIDTQLEALHLTEGTALLLSEAGLPRGQLDPAEDEAVVKVFNKLGGLPLTLRLASALVREEKLTFAEVADALAEIGVIDAFDAPVAALEDYQTNVSKALSRLIADGLGGAACGNADLLHALKVVACFPQSAIIRVDFLRHFVALEPGRFKRGDPVARIVRDLYRRNLVDKPGTTVASLRIHNLIHEYVRRDIDDAFFEEMLARGCRSILSPTSMLTMSADAFPHLARDLSLLTDTPTGVGGGQSGELLKALQRAIERQAAHLRDRCDPLQQIHYQAVADRATELARELQAVMAMRRSVVRFLTAWSTSGTDPSLVRTFRGHRDWVRSCSFDREGRRALSASSDRTLVLWDVATGDTIRTLEGHSAAVFSQCFSGPNDNALSASLDRRLILWDLGSGRPQQFFDGHNKAIIHCSASAEGSRGLSASDDRQILLWDLRSGTKIGELRAPDSWSSTCRLHPDGTRVVFGMTSGKCMVLDTRSGGMTPSPQLHVTAITDMSLSEDGRRALTAAMDGTVVLWDLEERRLLRQLRNSGSPILSCALDAAGRYGLTTTTNGTMALWDLETGERIRADHGHQGPILSCSLSRDGKKALSGATDGALMLWDLTSRRNVGTRGGHGGAVWCCDLSDDGEYAVSGGNDGKACLWETRTGNVTRTFGHIGHPIYDCSLNTARNVALTAGADGYIRQWDLRSGRQTAAVLAHQGPVRALDVSADGALAVSAGSDHTTCLWTIDTGTLTTIVRQQSSLVRSCAFNGDSSRLALGLSDGLILIWDRVQAAPVQTLRGHTGGVLACAFADADRLLLSASVDGSIRRWDFADTSQPLVLNLPGGPLSECGFRSDGRVALAVCGFRTVELWNVSERKSLASLSLDSLTSIAFSSNGAALVVGDGKGDLSFFRVELECRHEYLE